MDYDVIIIGAGIAGLSAALNLKKANQNLKILLIEKHTFPRSKLCAGYLTEKSKKLLLELGLDIEKIDYKLVKGLSMIYKDKPRIKASNHGLYCQKLIDRTVLDCELFELVKKSGIEIKESLIVESLDEAASSILFSGIKYYYKHLIFADGELGFSAKFNQEKKQYFAMQMNFEQKEEPKIDMYFGIAKKGYAWRASSGKYVNVGYCDIYDKRSDYYQIFNDFAKKLGYEQALVNNKVRGFFVPYGLKKRQIIGDNIYLTGDAAGLVDPLTLAGISYAILSGKHVAKAIVNQENQVYLNYLKKVKFKFRILKVMTNILYNPLTLFFIIRGGGHFFGRLFSHILDKFILNKGSGFHE